MKRTILMAAAIAAVGVGATAAQAAFVSIDNYHQPETTMAVDQAGTMNHVLQYLPLPLTTAVGGSRDMVLNRVSAGLGNASTDGAMLRAGGTADSLAFSSDPGILGTMQLMYGAQGDLNMNLSGFDGLVLGFVNADQPLTFDVTIMSGGMTSSTESFVVPAGDSTRTIDFSVFSNLNTSDIDKVTYMFHPAVGGDFILVEPAGSPHVPEPASLGLLGLGALALLRRR